MSSFRSSFWDRSGSQSGSQSRSQPVGGGGWGRPRGSSHLPSQSGGGGWRRPQASSPPKGEETDTRPNFTAALLAALLLLPFVTSPVADDFTTKYVASHSPPGTYTDKDIQVAIDHFNRQRRESSGFNAHGRGNRRDEPLENKVYVGDLPPGCTNEQLRRVFMRFRLQVIGIYINYDKCYANVTFSNPDDAAKAIIEANGYTFNDGYTIRVEVMRQPSDSKAGQSEHSQASQPRRNQTDGYQPQRNDPNNFFGKILSRIKAFQYVLPQIAVDFTRNYTREHGNKEQGEFTSKDVDAAIEAFKEQVDPYHILGFPERSVPLKSLPSAVRAKIFVALNMSTAGPSGLSGVHAIPNAYVFIGGTKGTQEEKYLRDWSKKSYYKAPLMFFIWNAGLNQFTLLKDRCYHDDLVLVMPKCIGSPIKTTRCDMPIIPNGGYNHFDQDAILANGGEYKTGSVDEVDDRGYNPDDLNQVQANMTERLSSWCDPMEAMGAIKLCVHFQQEASTSASADPCGEEDSTSSNPWGAAAPSASSNPWGAAAP